MKNFKGQTLIEVLFALSIIAIVMSAVGGAVTSSLNSAQAAKNKTLATKYTQEGMEAIRDLRNSNYTKFKTYSGKYCLGTIPAVLNVGTTSCAAPNVANFIRTVLIEQSACGANIARVTVTASWTDGNCPTNNLYCHAATHTSCLSTSNPIQAP